MNKAPGIQVPAQITADVGVEGERVVFRLRNGRQTVSCDMPPQVAVQISNQLHKAAREAKRRTNARRA